MKIFDTVRRVEEKAGKRNRVKLIGNNEGPKNSNHHLCYGPKCSEERVLFFPNFIQLLGSSVEKADG